MDFVNRETELAFLNKQYGTAGFQFVPVHGRRRIGKTRLVQEFIRDKDAVYFLADALPEREQLRALGRMIGERFKDTILTESGFRDWEQMFSYLETRCSGGEERMVLVIDEYPYLVSASPPMSTVFQKGIDGHLKGTDIFLVLMGSSIGMMEKEVLFYKAPLYGRRTGNLEVPEMGFDALRGFFPEKSFEELMGVYAVFGTVPAYLEMIDPAKDILTVINEQILERGTFFYNEVEFILREELREPRNYFAILKAIAQGKRKLAEIINETGFEKSLVSKYIDTLRTLKFVDKDIPVTEKVPEKSKQGMYRLHDRFFAFWFKYVFPNRSRLEIGNTGYVMKQIADSFEHHISFLYEDACRQLCAGLMRDGRMNYTVIGRWWSRLAEIDIVALDEGSGTAYFCECKWSNKKVGEDIYRGLVDKSRLVDWQVRGNRKDRYVLFSGSGFTKGMQETAKREGVLLVAGDVVVSA